jgi:hypothetical protein
MNRLLIIISLVFLIFSIFIINNTKGVLAKDVVVYSNKAWQMTDIILKKNHTIRWTVKEDDAWCFNTELFPDGHNADGIPVPALDSYALPGENIGKLLGKKDEDNILSMGLSGSFDIGPNEGGCYLYLTMNDDLIGKYGGGFSDNEGELLVSITQTPRKVAEIYIMFINGCPGISTVAKYIKEVIAEEAIDAKISMVLIETLENARKLHFTGSPTVRINGMDVETNSLDNKDYGLQSRQYYMNGKKYNIPSKSMIKDAVKNVK